MFAPKAVHAQVAAICREREARGEPAYQLYRGMDEIYTISSGSICFIPDKQTTATHITSFEKIRTEPVLIATNEPRQFILLSHMDNDLTLFDLDEDMEPNYVDDAGEMNFYILVVHDLNFLFSDGAAPTLSQQQERIVAHLEKATTHMQKVAAGLGMGKRSLPFL